MDMHLSSDTSSKLTGMCVLWCAQALILCHRESSRTPSFSIFLEFFITETAVCGDWCFSWFSHKVKLENAWDIVFEHKSSWVPPLEIKLLDAFLHIIKTIEYQEDCAEPNFTVLNIWVLNSFFSLNVCG